MRTHLIHRPARDIIPPLGGARVSFYWIKCCTVFMLLLWPVLGSSGTRCRQPIYAGSGKATVEGCRSIDVLEWHRRGYLQTPRWFSWAWTREGERVASINVETQRHAVTLKYRS